jgi:hypothetical protein
MKRQRERAQADRRKEKFERRQEAKARRSTQPGAPEGEDPDIAGIKPGPQRSPYADMIEDEVEPAPTEEE